MLEVDLFEVAQNLTESLKNLGMSAEMHGDGLEVVVHNADKDTLRQIMENFSNFLNPKHPEKGWGIRVGDTLWEVTVEESVIRFVENYYYRMTSNEILQSDMKEIQAMGERETRRLLMALVEKALRETPDMRRTLCLVGYILETALED